MVEVCWINGHEEVFAFDLFSGETCERKRRPVAPFQSHRWHMRSDHYLSPKWRHESIFSKWDVSGTGQKPVESTFSGEKMFFDVSYYSERTNVNSGNFCRIDGTNTWNNWDNRFPLEECWIKKIVFMIFIDTFVAIYIEIFPILTLLFIVRGLLPLRAPSFCLLIRLTRASFSWTFNVKFLYSIKHLLRVIIYQILLTFASLCTLYTNFQEMSSWLTGKQPTYYCFNSLTKYFLICF